MNLHSIAAANVSAINPQTLVTVKLSTGYSTDLDGSREPTYVYHNRIPAQIQALTYNELQMLDGLQIQGERRAIYLNGRLEGINRSRNTGGDLIVFPDGNVWPFGTVWKVVLVVEQWPNWVKVAVTLQNGV